MFQEGMKRRRVPLSREEDIGLLGLIICRCRRVSNETAHGVGLPN